VGLRGVIRIEDHLDQAVAIAQVYENHAAVVAPPVDPASESDGFSCVLLTEVTACNGLEHLSPEEAEGNPPWP
jgi:hypothetical protein